MKKKILILTGLIIVVCIASICIWYFGFRNNQNLDKDDKKENVLNIKNELVVEVGEELPQVSQFVENNVKGNVFINYDDSVETLITYYNSNNEEVSADEAIEYESLKKDYTSKEIVTSIGEFKVTLKYENKDYYSKLIVKDTTEPKLILKDINIKENENVDINNFVDSVTDNSRKEVTLSYVSALTDYEKLEKLDLSIGEHDVFIEAKDNSDNKVVVQTKLTITKKQQTNTTKPTTNTNNQNTNTNSSTNQSNTQSGSGASNNFGNNTQTQNPWDILGISEYDYYNKPTHDWMRVDIDAKNYSTQEETFNACKSKGENSSPYENYSYMCTPVETHSGKFLGYMLTYTELKP